MSQEAGLLSKAYNEAFKLCLAVVERNVVPDAAVRRGIRYLLAQRVKQASRSARWLAGAGGVGPPRRGAATQAHCPDQAHKSSAASCNQADCSSTRPCRRRKHSHARPLPQTTAPGEEYERRLQAFVEELKGMPVAVQVRRTPGTWDILMRTPSSPLPSFLALCAYGCLAGAPGRAVRRAGRRRAARAPETAGLHHNQETLCVALLNCAQTAAANEQHYEVPTEYFLKARACGGQGRGRAGRHGRRDTA